MNKPDFERLVLEQFELLNEKLDGNQSRSLSEHVATRRAFREELVSLRVELGALKGHMTSLISADSVREQRLVDFERRLAVLERYAELRSE